MRSFPVFKNNENKKYILLGVYYVLECKFYCVLYLDEVIYEGILQSWTADKILGSKCLGIFNWAKFYFFFYSAYNNIKISFNTQSWRYMDEEYMHIDGLLKCAQRTAQSF